MTMIVCIFCGSKSIIEAPMLIFTNKNSNYSIHRLDDFIPRESYCTDVKVGWTNHYFPNTSSNHELINWTFIIALNIFE